MLLRYFALSCLAAIATFTPLLGQDCSVPYVPSNFKARLAWKSGQDGVSALATPVVANMNPQVDDIPEIMVGAYGSGNTGIIEFYRGDGSNQDNPMRLTIPGNFDLYPVPGPTVGDIDGDGKPELLMSSYDRRIRVFHNYTENPTDPMTLWITSSSTLDEFDQRPYLADFDADGIPEVYAGNDVFLFDLSNPAAPTLTKAINGNSYSGQAHYDNSSQGATNSTAVDILTPADCNGDPDCNGLELVAGPVIYSVDLDLNDGDGYELKVQRNLNTMVPPANQYFDGYTAVADVNLDGLLDVIVTARRTPNRTGVYVWDKNGLIRFMTYPGGNFVINSGSLACVANVYDDTQAGFAKDYPEILICSSFNFTCYNLNAAQATPNVPYWWNQPTSDFSGWTGSSVYDFNGDGISEIVYRDEQNFRIMYGGRTPFPAGVDAQRNWFKTPCFSGTSDEYPVVADVDNDGETEIAVTGRLVLNFPNNLARLHVFESDAGPWVPCRNVWNQYNYFVANVNDDLSIPAVQQTHHLELPNPGSGNRPLNRYLAQRPVFNDDYVAVVPLPDAGGTATPAICKQDSLVIDLNICNTGDQTLHAGIPVAFYFSDPTTTNAQLLGLVQYTNAVVLKDSCVVFRFTVPKTASTIYGVINDDGSKPRPYVLATDFPVTAELECNWLNNIFQFENFPPANLPVLGPDISTCNDTIVTLSPGAGYLSYLWQDGSIGTVFEAPGPGEYWVETTDFCSLKQRDTVIVNLIEQPVIQIDTTNGDCFGTPATVTVQASTNYHPLKFEWSTGDVSPSMSGLADGMYTVTVTNARGCSSIDSTWVEAGGTLDVSALVAAPIMCFGQPGALDLDLLAGKAPYVFQWSNGAITEDLSAAPAGDYSVTVTDADLCQEILQISLTQPTALLSAGISSAPSCPGMANGELVFGGASQGTPPYSIVWSTSANTPMLTGLAAGAYQLSITDANGCTLEELAQVGSLAAPNVSQTLSDVSCNGAGDGSINLLVSGGTPGFAFNWANGATAPGIQQLSAGNYTVTVTYADGKCAQTFDYQITEPAPILLNAQANPAACNGGTSGSIDLTVQNGIAPLAFTWSNNASTEDLLNLSQGNYQVTVTDANGCSKTYQQAVTELPGISLSSTATMPLCAGGADGVLQLTPGNGTPPFQVLWSTGSSNLAVSGLTAGVYTATVTDATACSEVLSLTLGEPLALSSAGITTVPACPGLSNGELQFLGASQGTAPYTLLWSNNTSTPQQSGLPAGAYTLTVTDAHGCTLLETAQVAALIAPITNATVSDVSCFGSNDGSISMAISSGSPGFAFNWSNNSTTASIANLAPGNYGLQLSYGDGKCSQIFDYQINEPSAVILTDTLLTPVRCFGETNGAIQLSSSGGTPPYQYLWTGGQQSEDLSNLAAGNYQLSLTDSHGCVFQAAFDITQPPALSLQSIVAADTCETGTGAILAAAGGGVMPYQYHWSNGSTAANLSQLVSGNYQVTISDGNACTQVSNIPVAPYGQVPVISPFGATITCLQPSVQIGLTSNQNSLHYQWMSAAGPLADQATQTITSGGSYQVTATNAFGCSAATQIMVLVDTQVPLAEAGAAMLHIPCNVTETTLDASGSSSGSGFSNTWAWLPNGVPAFDTAALTIPISQAGLYVHTVINQLNGCAASDSILISWDEPISAELAVIPIQCFGDNDGVIRIENLAGGTAPFYYSIDNQIFTSQNKFTGLLPGTYPVLVRDDWGCRWESSVTLTEPAELSVTLSASDLSIQLGQSVQLTASPSPSGVDLADISWAPATFAFENMSLVQRVKPETPTDFSVRIVDQHGCVAEDRLSIAVYNHHIYVPNIIYPESDNNGAFTIFAGDGLLDIQLLRVFDRWGEIVFEKRHFQPNTLSEGWDGTFRGQQLNPAVFAWYAELLMEDGQVLFLKGDVTVLR